MAHEYELICLASWRLSFFKKFPQKAFVLEDASNETEIPLNAGEINKHMQDLSAEFEELFDPYLPVASKLKIKSCPGMGVSAEGFAKCITKIVSHFPRLSSSAT